MPYQVRSGPTGRVNVLGVGPPFGHANSVKGGLGSERFREVARVVGLEERRVLAMAVERAIADALVDCPTERSAYAWRDRGARSGV